MKGQQRIAIIGSKGFYSEYGGVEKLVFHLSSVLSQKHTVIVFGDRAYRDKEQLERGKVIVRDLRIPQLKLLGAALLSLWATIIALREGFDVFYYHACGPGFVSFIPRLFRKRVLWHFHGSDYLRSLATIRKIQGGFRIYSRLRELTRFLYLRLGEVIALHAAHRIFVLGRTHYRELSGAHPRLASKLVKINNFVYMPEHENNSYFRLSGLETNSYILSVSRLVAEKNIDFLIAAFQQINRDYPNLRLVIIGEGEERDRLQAMVGKEESILFLGSVAHHQLVPFYGKARLFCLCSSLEGQSLAVLEAIYCGCPVVASDLPETAEIGEGTLFLYKPDDKAHFIETLHLVLRNPDDAKQKADLAQKKVQLNYTAEKALSVIEAELRSLPR